MKLITTQSALENPNWEMILTGYEDPDYSVFKEVGMKEKSTIWLHVHENYTGVFINENQFLRILNTWEQLGNLKEALFGELQD